MNRFDPIYPGFWVIVATAIACGAAIGLERQFRGKPAGIRTSILVCLGTASFVGLGAALVGPSSDPTRVLGQVVTGVGFLGAGLIMVRKGVVSGVTSAAVIWILAAIGAAAGLELWRTSLTLTSLVILVLIGIEQLERSFLALRRGVHSRLDRDPDE